MLIFSEIHDWEGDESVKQVLVFLSRHDYDTFMKRVPNFPNTADGSSADTANGAIAKLRAIRGESRVTGQAWTPMVRSGFTGHAVEEFAWPNDSHPEFATAEEALQAAFDSLVGMFDAHPAKAPFLALPTFTV